MARVLGPGSEYRPPQNGHYGKIGFLFGAAALAVCAVAWGPGALALASIAFIALGHGVSGMLADRTPIRRGDMDNPAYIWDSPTERFFKGIAGAGWTGLVVSAGWGIGKGVVAAKSFLASHL